MRRCSFVLLSLSATLLFLVGVDALPTTMDQEKEEDGQHLLVLLSRQRREPACVCPHPCCDRVVAGQQAGQSSGSGALGKANSKFRPRRPTCRRWAYRGRRRYCAQLG